LLCAVLDRKNYGQGNRDDNVKQIKVKKISNFRQRYFSNGFMNHHPNVTSSPLADSEINYSLPDLTQEDSVFEAPEASSFSPTVNSLHVATLESSRPNRTVKLSASMGEYLDDITQDTLQVTSNPLHSSTESDLHIGAYTNKAMTDDSHDSREQLPSNGHLNTGSGISNNNTETEA